jgi:hypothetical protein
MRNFLQLARAACPGLLVVAGGLLAAVAAPARGLAASGQQPGPIQ